MDKRINLYNFGVIEVMDLSYMGFMSYNRANKIRKDVYEGRPWRLPKSSEIFYLGDLSQNYGVKLLDAKSYYWTSHFSYLSQMSTYSPEGNFSTMKKNYAGARLILVRDL